MEISPSARPLVLLNPTSNRGHMEAYRALVKAKAEENQGEYIETQRGGEVEERAKQAALQGRPVVAVGGDGTVHEAVNGILSSGCQVPLGLVGAGSGNDYAWVTLNLPKDPAEAVERAFHGRVVQADAGKLNGRYFANAFSVGLDGEIAAMAARLKKYPLMSGFRLYYTSTITELLFGYHKCPFLHLNMFDGEKEFAIETNRYVLIAISNGPTYGAGFRINPKADYQDGFFDICTIRYTPLLRALRLLPIVQKGEHENLPEVTFYRAKKIDIECRKPAGLQVDGEATREISFHAEILPGALQVRL